MKLLVDLGNSRLKWARCANDAWNAGATIVHRRDTAVCAQWWDAIERPESVWIASVAEAAFTDALRAWCVRRWQTEVHNVSAEAQAHGVRNLYDAPATLGADRWCALIAARQSAKTACVIVDAGSALTIDALAYDAPSGDGTFMGGVILPGLNMMRATLGEGTGLIRDTTGRDDDVLARATASGVAAGTLFGLAGAVDAVVAAQRKQIGASAPVLLCGGDGATLLPRLRATPITLIPDLVLRGLAIIAGCKPPAAVQMQAPGNRVL